MVVCRVFHPGLMPKATDILLQQDATGQPQQNEWEECMFNYTQDFQPCVRNILKEHTIFKNFWEVLDILRTSNKRLAISIVITLKCVKKII